MNRIYYVLDNEPTPAQKEQCSGVRKAYALEKWVCTIAEDGNCTLFGPVEDALTGTQARAVVREPGWNMPVPP